MTLKDYIQFEKCLINSANITINDEYEISLKNDIDYFSLEWIPNENANKCLEKRLDIIVNDKTSSITGKIILHNNIDFNNDNPSKYYLSILVNGKLLSIISFKCEGNTYG